MPRISVRGCGKMCAEARRVSIEERRLSSQTSEWAEREEKWEEETEGKEEELGVRLDMRGPACNNCVHLRNAAVIDYGAASALRNFNGFADTAGANVNEAAI